MAVEKYIAAASLGLFIMFAAEMITIYDFMINSESEVFEPESKLLQFISIGVAPALILTGVSYIMCKRYGSKPIGAMIFAGGVSLLVGMIITFTLVDRIKEEFLLVSVIVAPLVFMAVSIPVMVFGGLLMFRIKKRRAKKDYL